MSSEVVTIFDELREHFREVLRGMNGVSVDKNGYYYSECYKDYMDELEDSTVAEILKNSDPMSKFEDHLQWAYCEAMIDVENDVCERLLKNTVISEFVNNNGISEDDLRSCLCEVWYVNPPYDDFLKQEVCMDIMLDTGDCNYEFTCNNLASTDIESVEDFDDNSSLLWLCEQQGVTREELLAAFDKGTAHSDEVINLRKQKNAFIEELKKHGYDVPSFNRSARHSGAFKDYLDLTDVVYRYKPAVERLNIQIKDNDVSYEEYRKEFFERNGREAPLTEEAFEAEKPKILESLSERLKKAEDTLNKAQTQLENDTELKEVARLYDAHKSVVRRLSALAKTNVYKKAEFIGSVHNECVNTFSGPNVVTFLVKMPLEDAIRLCEVINREDCVNNSYYYEERKGLSSIVIDKDVRCGLMDDCNGGGSVFEIKLLKDVEIPIKALYRAVSDKCNGNYGFMEIYGTNEEVFSESLKEIREVELPKVNELIADAQDRAGDTKNTEPGKDSLELG